MTDKPTQPQEDDSLAEAKRIMERLVNTPPKLKKKPQKDGDKDAVPKPES
jgi:hypothetical protein